MVSGYKNILCITLAFVLTALAGVSLSLLSARVDNQIVSASILGNLQTGTAVFPSSMDRNIKTGIDTWTACDVLKIATYGEKDCVSALARSDYLRRPSDTHPCDHLESNIGGESGSHLSVVYDYWRYWWGSAALLNIALGIFHISLPSYQMVLKFLTYLSIALVVCVAFLRYRCQALPFLPLAFALTFGFGIPLFGQSIAHAPGLIVGLLLLSVYMVGGVDRAPLRWQFIYVFFAGGFGFYFDLLNGDLIAVMLTFALIKLLSVRAFGRPRLLLPVSLARFSTTVTVLHVMMTYVVGAVSMALFRIVLRATLLHQNFFGALSEWHEKLSIYSTDKLAESGLEQLHLKTLTEIIQHCYYNLEVATFPYVGRHATLAVYVFGCFAYVGLCAWIVYNRKNMKIAQLDNLVAAALIASVIPLWFVVFAVHAIIHFFMMGRLLMLFFSLSISIAAILIADITKTPAPYTKPRIGYIIDDD